MVHVYGCYKRWEKGMFSKKYRWLCFLLSGCLLTGCSYSMENGNMSVEHLDVSHDIQIEEADEKGNDTSSYQILINQTGYRTNARKVAIFHGDEPVKYFELLDKDTGKVVFKGEAVEKGYDELSQKYCSYGIFDDLTAEGRYYIQIPDQNDSDSFYIKDDIYNNIFLQACRNYYNRRCKLNLPEDGDGKPDISGGWHQTEKDTKCIIKASQTMANLMLSYELFGKTFSDASGIPESGNGIPDILDELKYEADWFLKMQDKNTGGVYTRTVSTSNSIGLEPITSESTVLFAAIMAKFAYIYQTFNAEYSKDCLNAAEKAWDFVENNNDEVKQRLWAAAELYRASGYSRYKRAAEEYLISDIYKKMDDNYYFWGCVTYLATERSVDVNLCDKIMKELMSEAEEISESSRKAIYLTAGNKQHEDNDKLLNQMMRLTVADYIISNHEYETVIENHLHYFMGRNANAVNYIEDIVDNSNGELIFMLSEILSRS